MSCPRCPHCVASGAFGLIDPSDPALATNQPSIKEELRDLVARGMVKLSKGRYTITAKGRAAAWLRAKAAKPHEPLE